jgi:hypothetical protein
VAFSRESSEVSDFSRWRKSFFAANGWLAHGIEGKFAGLLPV